MVYLYKCKNKQCHRDTFEVTQSIRDEHTANCPDCGKEGRRVYSTPNISFKGKGFHSTDYR